MRSKLPAAAPTPLPPTESPLLSPQHVQLAPSGSDVSRPATVSTMAPASLLPGIASVCQAGPALAARCVSSARMPGFSAWLWQGNRGSGWRWGRVGAGTPGFPLTAPVSRWCPADPEHPLTVEPTPPAGYSSLGAIIGIVVLATLLLVLAVLFLYYRHRQKGKEGRPLAAAYTVGRPGSSEYVVPGEAGAAIPVARPGLRLGAQTPGFSPCSGRGGMVSG